MFLNFPQFQRHWNASECSETLESVMCSYSEAMPWNGARHFFVKTGDLLENTVKVSALNRISVCWGGGGDATMWHQLLIAWEIIYLSKKKEHYLILNQLSIQVCLLYAFTFKMEKKKSHCWVTNLSLIGLLFKKYQYSWFIWFSC